MSESSSTANGRQYRSKSSWAYDTVRGMILAGELPAGSNIDQQALAARLGISTTPLREALRRLEAENYIHAQDHREVRVAPPLSRPEVGNLYAIRLLLDPYAAQRACELATDAQVRRVQSLLPPDSGLSPLEYLMANREFHRAIYSASGNPELTRVLEGLWDQCDRYRVGLIQDVDMGARARSEHSQMCVLLAQRDGVGMAKLMRDHLTRSLEWVDQEETALRESLSPDDMESHESAATA